MIELRQKLRERRKRKMMIYELELMYDDYCECIAKGEPVMTFKEYCEYINNLD